MSEAAGLAPQRRLPSLGEIASDARRSRLVLALLFLACALPGFFTMPILDRDEARFAQATRQMVESGDYVTPRLGEETRFKKPIGIYWLQAAAVRITGHGADAPIWVYRLPSLIAGCLVVLLIHAIGLRLFGPRAALVAGALMAASIILGAEARLAKTDATQLAAAVAGQFALARLYLAKAEERLSIGWPLLFWGAMGAGILVKGPIVPMLAGLTILGLVIWDRRAAWLRRLRPAIGLPLLLAIVAPWLIVIAMKSGTAFFEEAVGRDLLGKVATGQESHGLPPGAHFLTFFFIFWPGAALAAAAAPWAWANRNEPAVRFCLCWAVPFFLAFELIATKLPHYTLPAYPAIALLAGAALASGALTPPRGWMRLFAFLAAAGGSLAAIGLVGALYWFEGHVPFQALLLAAAALPVGAIAVVRSLRMGLEAVYVPLFAQAIVLYTLGYGVVMPRLDALWLSPRVAEVIARDVSCGKPRILVAGFYEASVLFELGTDVQFSDGAGAADFLATPGCRVAVVAQRERARFDARNRELGRAPEPLATVSGVNSGTMHPVSLAVLAAEGAAK
ncbi:glycosyltransferase family 39 protein [Bosea sp. 117]|uniref:ArnT family glycosyltransferase n=1 Tax=Bosea sp. 117 TaxID=1125973 RepID=UPI00056F7F6D|nr:glycosyltransferase family 39 protein [Bosea sp. 117]